MCVWSIQTSLTPFCHSDNTLALKMSFGTSLFNMLLNTSLISFGLRRLMFGQNRQENLNLQNYIKALSLNFSSSPTFRTQTLHVTPRPPTAPTWAAHRALHPHTRVRLSLWSAVSTWAGRHELCPGPLPSDFLWGPKRVMHTPETESRLLIHHIPKHAAGPRCVCLRVLVCICITRVIVVHTHITVHLTSLLSGPITTVPVPVLDGGPLSVAYHLPPPVWTGSKNDKQRALTWIYQCLLTSVPHLTQEKICIQKS